MASRKIDALLTNFSQVSCWHVSKIRLELASKNSLDVASLVELAAEEDVVAEFVVLDPGLLLTVSCGSFHIDGTLTGEILSQ